jgi:glycogen synthase
MEIIHISAECYPVAKAGGLGDVVGALPKYQNKLGACGQSDHAYVSYKIFI